MGHWALGMGHWAWGMGHWALGIGHGEEAGCREQGEEGRNLSPAPCTLPPAPLPHLPCVSHAPCPMPHAQCLKHPRL